MICNQDIPEKKCPKVNCRRDDCCGCPFRKVVIPAVTGDDKTGQVIPENGLFTNALVEYEANGALYIYSSDGIFTDITPKQGKPGQSALSVTVGETNTGDPDTNARVVNSGTDSNIVLDFTIPRGAQGPQGPAGESAVTVNVGSTTTGSAGEDASVTNSGTDKNVVLDFVIPRGAKGENGETGPEGPQGVPGKGITTVSLNPDYTLTLNYSDGSSYTTSSIRGEQGPQGPAGTSPNNSQVNFKDTDANTIGSFTVNQESDSNITIPTASSTRFGMIKARYDSSTGTLYLSTSGEA